MSKEIVVAKRYAKALFAFATTEKIVLEAERDLTIIVAALRNDPTMMKFFVSPNIPMQVKTNVLKESLATHVVPAVLRIIQLMIQRRRVHLLSHMLDSYVQLSANGIGVTDAKVYSSYALSEQEQRSVFDTFKTHLNKRLRLKNIVDSSLLGGLKIVVGDTIYDGSLAGKLMRLKQSFNRSV